jgi:hypothetical protein
MMKASGRVAATLVAILGWGLPLQAQAQGQGGSPPLADDPTLIALAVSLACADAPDVVAAAPAQPAVPAADGPELELVATVRAKALRFDEVPKVDVVFRGTGKRRTVWKTERVNLPAHPEPGVVYRDVQVRLTITTGFEELGAMLEQAKRASRGIRIEQEVPPVVPAAAPAPAAPTAPAAPVPPNR